MNGQARFMPLVIGIPAGLLFAGSVLSFLKSRTVASLLELIGAASLIIVVLAHVAEALSVLPVMGWGLERSPGHYLDLSRAVLALALFPLGYFLQTLGA